MTEVEQLRAALQEASEAMSFAYDRLDADGGNEAPMIAIQEADVRIRAALARVQPANVVEIRGVNPRWEKAPEDDLGDDVHLAIDLVTNGFTAEDTLAGFISTGEDGLFKWYVCRGPNGVAPTLDDAKIAAEDALNLKLTPRTGRKS